MDCGALRPTPFMGWTLFKSGEKRGAQTPLNGPVEIYIPLIISDSEITQPETA
jgi:hypothetical protein